jgi:hypothetical protein
MMCRFEHKGGEYDDTCIVFSCDQRYFPFAKGFVLSVMESFIDRAGITVACIDVGCDLSAQEWFRTNNVTIVDLTSDILGDLSNPELGYRRSQLCRPFLPDIFPEREILVWVDCDIWIQEPGTIEMFVKMARLSPRNIVLCPEEHVSYSALTKAPSVRRERLFRYYEPFFGSTIAEEMAQRTVLNSGLFAMSRRSPVWGEWARCLIMTEKQEQSIPVSNQIRTARHFLDQTALNVVTANHSHVTLVSALYNYVCLFGPPLVDSDGVVRAPNEPHLPIAGIHLAGGPSWHRYFYKSHLFYRRGEYLTNEDVKTLFGVQQGCP